MTGPWVLVLDERFATPAPLGGFAGAYPGWGRYDGLTDTTGRGRYDTAATVSVAGGVADVWVRSIDGQPTVAALLPPVGGDPWSGQVHGRYEVTFRADPVPGYKIAWLLWPASDVWDDGEVDYPEGPLDGEFAAHSLCIGAAPEFCFHSAPLGRMSGWRTAVTEWAPGRLAFLLDGAVVGETTDPRAIPTGPMRWVLQTETADAVAPAAAAEGHVQIAGLRIWAWSGDAE
ncbi:LamG domain-containing protein [Geodermatophilus marinus]|uniref:glycoside hydrolase n=1 Tax=Geodermatophilus sp. LHW52908 TaxID=2303986 RepID=UPI000E3C0674|nr:glycoside hydrolase [Geodermatophilus sp. LHW52908]RFU20356.1 glycoside hydrolase [Geodermatophilus sp. LHW52908]